MNLKAQCVSCNSALGGEILQVKFSERKEDQDDTRYLLISRNFEFSGGAHAEWLDREHDGGGNIRFVSLYRDRIMLTVNADTRFVIEFDIADEDFRNLSRYISRIFDSKQIVHIVR